MENSSNHYLHRNDRGEIPAEAYAQAHSGSVHNINPQDFTTAQSSELFSFINNILTTRSGEDCSADLKQDVKKLFPFLNDSSAVWIDVNILVAPQPPPMEHHVPPFYQPYPPGPFYSNPAPQAFAEHPFYPPHFAQQPPPGFLAYPPQHGNYENFVTEQNARNFNPPPFVPTQNGHGASYMGAPAKPAQQIVPDQESLAPGIQLERADPTPAPLRKHTLHSEFTFNSFYKRPEPVEVDKVKILQRETKKEDEVSKKLEEPIKEILKETREIAAPRPDPPRPSSNVLCIQPPQLYQALVKPNLSFNAPKEDYGGPLLQKRGLSSAPNPTFKLPDGEEQKVKQRLISGQIKKIKFFWRGTNFNYPYTFKRNYHCVYRDSGEKHFTEIVDLSKKVIQPNLNFENKF